ncbi:hypothetical protein BH23ACI1_BH23ACI1_08820 [soil metagenome]
MSGRAAETAGVSALALLLALAIAAPVLRAPSERLFGMEIVGRHHDPFSVIQQFGGPLTFGVHTQPFTDVPGALLARAMGGVPAYNWLILLTFPLSAAAAYLLARQLALSPVPATFAALTFAFSPFHLAQSAYHPHIAQTQWVPLYLLALWRCLENPKPAALCVLVAATAGVTLSNFYGGLIAAAVTPMAVAAYWSFISRHEPRSSRSLALTLGMLTVLAVGGLAYAWYAAHPVVMNPAAFGYPREDLFRYAAKLWSYLMPPVAHPIAGPAMGRWWHAAGVREGLLEQQVSLGWGIVTLAAVALVTWLVRDRSLRAIQAVPVLALVALVAIVCSLSPERVIGPFTFTRPSAILYTVLPMFRSYARFAVVVQLMAVLLAAIGAERLWRAGTPLARGVCAALVALAAAEYMVAPQAMWRDVLPTSAHRWIVQQPGDVRGLDCATLTVESQSVQWLTANRISLRTTEFDDCTQPNIGEKLSAFGYTHLIVRRPSPEARWFARRSAPEGLRPVGRFRDAQVFAVTAPPPPVYTERMTAFYPREHDDEWEWRWMGSDAAWTIVNRTARPVRATLSVEMTAFAGARGLRVLLDGREVQTLSIGQHRGTYTLGPLTLAPGAHELVFRPADAPGVADDLEHNGDMRALSFGVGGWHWRVQPTTP